MFSHKMARSTAEGSTPVKRKLSSTSSDLSLSSKEGGSSIVLSPAVYLSMALHNKGIKSRVDPISIEQPLYFGPYTEAHIPTEVLRAVRENNVDKLRTFEQAILSTRNQFGESLIHIACRLGMSEVLHYLVQEVKLPLNLRDRFGRTPLHNACWVLQPNFRNLYLLLDEAPELVLFEDDKGMTPFDCISERNYEPWVLFLSEHSVLPSLQKKLMSEKGPHSHPVIARAG
jgi:ankyrin repeat protein